MQRTVDSVTNIGGEAVPGAVTPESRDDRSAAAASRHGANAGAGKATVRGRGAAFSPSVAVRAAEVAALQRWLARVWPAVPLGGVSGIDVVGAVAQDLFRPALAAVTGLLLASSPIVQASDDSSLAGQYHGVAGRSRSAPSPLAPAAADGGSIVYLIAIAALLALLAFTVWREFRIALHPRLR